jgi:predicted  nucleic acid-binding Zn-ribbon protein
MGNGEVLTQETDKLILPFSALASGRNEPFSEEAEKAAVFCLAELERGKGEGIVAKQPPEKLYFIAKAAYPLWLFPFHETSLIFDGLDTASHTFLYLPVPDTQVFTEGIERSASSRETYMAFLSDNLNYFQPLRKEESLQTKGLMAEPTFLAEFATYLSEAKPLASEESEPVLLQPVISENNILEEIHELENLKSRLSNHVKSLNKAMKLLSATTKEFNRAMRAEMKEIKERLNAELEKQRGPVEEEVRKERRKGDEETTTLTKTFEKQLLNLQKEKVKLEKARDQMADKIARSDAEIKSSATRKDKAAESRWKEEKSRLKKQRSETESSIKKLEKEIKDTEDQKGEELFRMKSAVEAKVQEANRGLDEIEAARDAEVQVLKQQMEKTEEQTSTIIKQIDEASKGLEAALGTFKNLGIHQESKRPSLVYVPLYLIGFQSETRKRYVHYPLSYVNSIKLLVKLKSALGVARIKQLFIPRSVALGSFLNRVPSMLEENAVLERETGEAAARSSILSSQDAKELVSRGLGMLKGEGWLSEKEHEAFSKALA